MASEVYPASDEANALGAEPFALDLGPGAGARGDPPAVTHHTMPRDLVRSVVRQGA
jgi:hypothetical protein